VSSTTSAATGTGSPHPDQAAAAAAGRLTRLLSGAAAAGIIGSILIMIVASVVRYSPAVPPMPWPPGWPPVEIAGHLSAGAAYTALWVAAAIGGGGVIAGLAAVARGARFPARLLIAGAFVAVIVFTLLPPAGSTDTLSYATFGRIAVLGHNPYVMTPNQLSKTGDPIGRLAIQLWRGHGSLYGPAATAEQWAAAKLGGTSAPRIIFWLKLWNAIVFLGVALGLDRMLRSDPARRARAHLLWSVNPLVLWGLVEGGHLDLLAAAACFGGLILVRTRRPEAPGQPARGPAPLIALAAGALVGVGVDFMLTYLLLAAALAWALRRWPGALLAAAAGFLVTFVPPYLAVGQPLRQAMLSRRGKVSADNFYQLFNAAWQHPLHSNVDLFIVLAVGVLAVLMLWRLPDAVPELPAIQPALAIGIAWLFLWYYQLPWYDTMIIALLALYPASRLDYVVILQLTAGTFAMMPGGSTFEPPLGWLRTYSHAIWFTWAPLVLLACAVAVVALCVTGAWNIGPPLRKAAAAAEVTPG
jgi:hypothetical protein